MDGFPAGLRVLVVDDDPTWLKILEKMLKKCSYEVTTCGRARAALDMLRERKDRFDIVISDVNMPDMDGFKLLEHVGLEMDLPVIMMSVDGETSRVMKGVQHGACDYLLKPIRMKELRIIWQHVYRKKINEGKENGSHDHEGNEGSQMMKNGLDDFEDEFFLCDSDPNCTKKRKEMENEASDGQEFNSNPGAVKKVRVVWSVELHKKFVSAVNQIGFDKVGPKKILDLMNVPGLTRENVASHLQKYRLYLSRLQRRNEPNTSFCGINPDFSSKDHPGKFGLQSSMTTQLNSPYSYGYSGNNSIVQDVIPEISEEKVKSIGSFFLVTEAKSSLRGDVPASQKSNSVPQLGIVCPFGGTVPDADCTSFGSSIPQQQPWSGKGSVVQLMQQAKKDHKPDLEYPHVKLHSQEHHFQVDQKKRTISVNGRTYITDTDATGPSEVEPLCTDYKRGHVRSGCLTDSFSASLEHKIAKSQEFGTRPLTSSSSSTKNHDPSQHSINGWGSPQSSTLKNGLFSTSSHEDLQLHSLQSYGCFENVWLDEMEFLELSASSISELQSYVYDGLRFNCDYQGDLIEYPVIDEGVFIA